MTIAQRVGAPDVAKQRATPVTITLGGDNDTNAVLVHCYFFYFHLR